MATLERLKGDKSQWQFFRSFAEEKGFAMNISFVTAKVSNDEIYDAFFNKTPKYKLKDIDGFARQAQSIYMDRLNVCAQKGLKASEAHAIATKSDKFADIMKSAQRETLEYIEGKLYDDYKKSSYYSNYVETQVDGGALYSALKFPKEAAKDLAWAKVMLILGNKAGATKAAQSAIGIKVNKADKRDGQRIPTTADVITSLERIKIKVDP